MSIVQTMKVRMGLQDDTLDQLWVKAEQLGRIEVERGIFSEMIEAKISFKNSNGSYIKATAKRLHVRDALQAVIEEAFALGAQASLNTR